MIALMPSITIGNREFYKRGFATPAPAIPADTQSPVSTLGTTNIQAGHTSAD